MLLLLRGADALAQPSKVELTAIVGHQFGAVVDETTKDEGVDDLGLALGVPGSVMYGLIFDYHVTPKMYLEVSWDQQPSELEFIDRPADTTSIVTDLTVDYFQVGLIYNWSDSDRQPFVGATVGVAHWQPTGDYQGETGLVFTPILGYQGWVNDYFGLRAQLKFMISNMPSGTIFRNNTTGQGFEHTKDTWATQISLSVGITVGR